MTDQDKKSTAKAEKKETAGEAGKRSSAPAGADAKKGSRKPPQKSSAGNNRDKKDEFEQKILDIARVTRVMAGGKRMSFRACVAVGNRDGKIGVGLGKGADVAAAVSKAADRAKKDMVNVPIVDHTIPHDIKYKFGAAEILFKPSKQGRGIIAGGVVRIILELAGIKNITSKILGTNNKVNNSKCTVEALRNLKRVDMSKAENKKEEKKGADSEGSGAEKEEKQGSSQSK